MASKPTSTSTSEILNRVTDIKSEPRRLLPPIKGFEDKPLVTIDEAVEPLTTLVPDVKGMVWMVKEECLSRSPTHLTLDQRASIMLYTLEWSIREQSLYMILNQTLRSANRQQLKPWFLYLKLFLVALLRLPFIQINIFRGIKENLANEYPTGSDFVWWAFSSCTKTIEVLETDVFLGRQGDRTIFNIHCTSGIDIREHSFDPNENEILLLAARRFQVDSCVKVGHDLHMIQLTEIPASFPLLADVTQHVGSIPKSLVASTSKPPVKSLRRFVPTLPLSTRWSPQGVTILERLKRPFGLTVDEVDGTVYVADAWNHRIVATTPGSNGTQERVVAGGNGKGNGLHQVSILWDVLIDKETHSLIISDYENHRIMRWSLNDGTKQGEIMIDNIQGCLGLAMDDEGALYVSSLSTHDVRRFTRGDKTGTVVAGGNERGNGLHQLNSPTNIAVDSEGALYVSDRDNDRVMKWSKGATQGVVVAGDGTGGTALTQVSVPNGMLVDTHGTVYVAEGANNRVTRWKKGATTGELIVGGNGRGSQANQFSFPQGLSFDSHGHLFVADNRNNRVQRFSIG